MKVLWKSLRMFLFMTILTGVVYPLIITIGAQMTMNHKANGSFMFQKGKVIGSSLIGQKFEKDIYFWSRPSAVDYNPLPSGASNLGPTSAALKKAVEERKSRILKADKSLNEASLPSELLFASGSGLDPHITPQAAIFQIDRIVKARGKVTRDTLEQMIKNLTERRYFGFLGEPCVNVLILNNALDDLTKVAHTHE